MYCYLTYSQICKDFPTIPQNPYHPNSVYIPYFSISNPHHPISYQKKSKLLSIIFPSNIFSYFFQHVSQRFPNIFPTFFQHFPNIFPTFSQHFPNIFPTFSQHFSNIFPNIFPTFFPTFPQHFPNIFPTFSQHFSQHFPNIFPTFSQNFPYFFPTFSQHFPKISPTFSRKFPPKISKDKIVNMTNGVTPRRWVHCANPALSAIFTKYLGSHECPGAGDPWRLRGFSWFFFMGK